jgi:hypothetical protein
MNIHASTRDLAGVVQTIPNQFAPNGVLDLFAVKGAVTTFFKLVYLR